MKKETKLKIEAEVLRQEQIRFIYSEDDVNLSWFKYMWYQTNKNKVVASADYITLLIDGLKQIRANLLGVYTNVKLT